MDTQAVEIISNIFGYVSKFKQINTLTLVCKDWYQIMKMIQNDKPCKNFEDFILSDQIFNFPVYHNIFNDYICFMPRICPLSSHLYQLIDQKYKPTKIDGLTLLCWLFKNNYFKLVKRLGNIKNMITEKYISVCINLAIDNSNVEAICLLSDIAIEKEYYQIFNYSEFAHYACSFGNLDMIKYFHQKYIPSQAGLISFAKLATNLNYLDIVEYCLGMGIDTNFFDFRTRSYCDNIFYSGIIRLLQKYKSELYNDQDLHIIQLVVDGDINQLKHIHKHQQNLSNMSDLILKIALATNNVNIVKCICKDFPDSIVDAESKHIFENKISSTFMVAVRRGNLNIIKFLYRKYKLNIKNVVHGKYNNFIICSAGNGNVDLVKFLFDQGFTTNNINDDTYSSLLDERVNIIPIIKYIYDKYPNLITDYTFVLDVCCTHGTLDDFLYFKNLINNGSRTDRHYITRSIQHDNFSMLNHFYDQL